MRVSSGAVVSGFILTAMVLTSGCKPKNVVGGHGNKVSVDCKPNHICEVKLDEIENDGKPCVFNEDGSAGDSGEGVHDPFYLHISRGERLKILPEAAKKNKARFRDFTQRPTKAGCPVYPFISWKFTPGFSGNDVTGSPDPTAVGCTYKMTVQTNETGNDTKHPDDPKEPGTGFFCIDPHFEMVQ